VKPVALITIVHSTRIAVGTVVIVKAERDLCSVREFPHV
jgi:hypothetical protein